MPHEDALKAQFFDSYEQYSDAIFRHCFFRLRDRELAKDLMQETFLKTWQYLADGKTVENLRAFLYRIATNLIIDTVRKKKEISLEQLEGQGIYPSVDPEASVQAKIDVTLLQDKMKDLSEDDQELIFLRYLHDLSPQEIAQSLDVSPNVVSVRLNRAIQKLRTLLSSSQSHGQQA